MKDIAAICEINRRTLYRYFPTKDELAFQIEIVIMSQIQNYFNSESKNKLSDNGFQRVKNYFEKLDIDSIREQIKFTAEFDRYFQDDYPTSELEKEFVSGLDPKGDALYTSLSLGISDGSIRNDLSVDQLYHFISQNFLALFQRLLLREKHLKKEYCDNIDFHFLFKDIILRGIKA